MSTYLIRDKIACYVTWTYAVEADDEASAMEAFRESEWKHQGEPEIGDCIDSWPQETTIEAAAS